MPSNTVIYRATVELAQEFEGRQLNSFTSSGARGFSMLAPVRNDDVHHIKHDRHIYD
jgi:hypothetical protein